FCSLRAFIELELGRWRQQIANWYQPQRELYLEVARQFIVQESLLLNNP
ncbi:MAG: IS701 family transposase, partial [Microcoleaceae cyanobacterium]